MKKRLKKEWQSHLMLLPGIITIFIFHYLPLFGLVIAFQKYTPGLGFSSPWVGFDNFTYLFSQPGFLRVIWNTLYISVFKLIGGIVVPVTFALLLNEIGNRLLKRIFQTMIYLPHFMSWVILAGVLDSLLSADGLVNNLLVSLGFSAVKFLGDADIFPWTLILSDIWKGFGFGTVVYLAALTSIDPELYDAAKVDGASRLRQVRHITLPMLAPTVILMSVLSLGNVLNAGFDQVFNMYSPVVYETGDIIDTYVYRMGIENAQYSVGTAVGMFKGLVSSVLVVLSWVLADKFANYRVF